MNNNDKQKASAKPKARPQKGPKKSAPKRKDKSSFTRVVGRQTAAVAYGDVVKFGSGKTVTLPNGGLRYLRREYIADVIGQETFTTVKYPVQPGNSTTFPWLAARARGFQKYRFNKLKFCYRPTCPSSTQGTVMLSPDYDSVDAAPISKIEANQLDDSVDGLAWERFSFDAKRENLHALPQYWISGNLTPAGEDVKTYNVANMFLNVTGFAANNLNVGELYVEYEVDLIAPSLKLSPFDSGELAASVGVSSTAPLGTAPVVTGSLAYATNSTTLTFNQAFQGLVVMQQAATAVTTPVLTGTALSSAVSVQSSSTATALSMSTIKANPGDTLILNLTGATVLTGLNIFFAAYTVSGGYTVLF